MAEPQPRNISDTWIKVLSLVMAILVWYTIKSTANLDYTNDKNNGRSTGKSEKKFPKPEKTPPLSDADGEKEDNGSGKE
ncbi:MAG: hypothetical protein QF685_11705 [Verrucomicrobiota bacterium]|jgi:hypothetical protein|nr:hypothetical protein [Verrucomicrobiota bacterium]